MSKYSKEEQTEIVKWAMNLQGAIESEKVELNRLKNEHFKSPPIAPTRRIIEKNVKVEPKYPAPPTYNTTFSEFLEEDVKNNPSIENKIFSNHPFKRALIISIASFILMFLLHRVLLLTLIISIGYFAFPASVFYYFKKYRNYEQKHKEMNKVLANSPQYLQARADAEKEAKEKQAAIINERQAKQEQLDLEYSKEKENYDTVLIPQYNDELALWTAQQQMKINIISDDLNSNRNTLAELYETTMLISKNNRTLKKLIWLYEDMSTSEHDIERATDLLNNQDLQNAIKKVDASVNKMQKDMNNGFAAVYSSIQQSNYIMQEGNYIMQDGLYDISNQLTKTRRNLNLGFMASGIQNYNTNRHLKTTNKHFEELRKKFG